MFRTRTALCGVCVWRNIAWVCYYFCECWLHTTIISGYYFCCCRLHTTIISGMSSSTRCIANHQCFAHVRRFVVSVFEEILLPISTTFANVDYTLLLLMLITHYYYKWYDSWTRCIANRQCFAHVRRFVVFVLEEMLLTATTSTTVRKNIAYYYC